MTPKTKAWLRARILECARKIQHSSVGSAQKRLRRLAKQEVNSTLEVYRCLVCDLWHIGHRKEDNGNH